MKATPHSSATRKFLDPYFFTFSSKEPQNSRLYTSPGPSFMLGTNLFLRGVANSRTDFDFPKASFATILNMKSNDPYLR